MLAAHGAAAVRQGPAGAAAGVVGRPWEAGTWAAVAWGPGPPTSEVVGQAAWARLVALPAEMAAAACHQLATVRPATEVAAPVAAQRCRVVMLLMAAAAAVVAAGQPTFAAGQLGVGWLQWEEQPLQPPACWPVLPPFSA